MKHLRVVPICLLAMAGVGAAASAGRGQAAAVQVPAAPKGSQQIEKLLRAFEGTWSIKEKFAPDAASPIGATGGGQIVWRAGPGRFSVIEEYRSKRESAEVTGLGVFWWDEAAQGYRTIWCESTNPGGCISFKNVARWEGPQLVLVEDYEVNGKKVIFKEVFGDIAPGGFTQTLYGGEAGKELKVDQIIQATKGTRGSAK
ncbi:MAG: hypothetical protein WCA49_09565 [Candidatus Sulfotelmatobacter sp.]